MKIVISPAKSLDFEKDLPITEFTQPQFLSKTAKLHNTLQQKSPEDLAKLMNISPKLSELNWQRYQSWKKTASLKNARQAIFAFNGDVYFGLDAYSLSHKKILLLQEKVRILSGFYGVLKPLDLIQAYRLEMGTALKVGEDNNLYQFWGEPVTQMLTKELATDEVLVNLASNEYFKVIQKKALPNLIITPVFQDFKNGQYKVISFLAKKARGMMVRFIIDNNIQKVSDLKKFDYGNYYYVPNNSTTNKLVFQRD